MREIKFRAWIGGSMILITSMHAEGVYDFNRVFPNPLMQYTGLKDRNGVEIYEGDVVRFYHTVGSRLDKNGIPHKGFHKQRVIEWKPTKLAVGYNFGDTKPENLLVVGNIYENPELIA